MGFQPLLEPAPEGLERCSRPARDASEVRQRLAEHLAARGVIPAGPAGEENGMQPPFQLAVVFDPAGQGLVGVVHDRSGLEPESGTVLLAPSVDTRLVDRPHVARKEKRRTGREGLANDSRVPVIRDVDRLRRREAVGRDLPRELFAQFRFVVRKLGEIVRRVPVTPQFGPPSLSPDLEPALLGERLGRVSICSRDPI